MNPTEKLNIPAQLEGLESTLPLYEFDGLEIVPNLVVDGLFSSHGSIGALEASEIDEQRRFMQAHDVVVVEASSLTPKGYKDVQKVAKGDYGELQKALEHLQLSDAHHIERNWTRVSLKTIYNIGRPVLVIDPPFGHTSYRGVNKYKGERVPAGLDFHEAIKSMQQQKVEYAEANLERENYMLRSFVEQTNQLASSHPRFKRMMARGESISVCLWALGITHTGLYDGISELTLRSGHDTQGTVSIFDAENTSLTYHSQIVSRLMRGLEVDDMLAAKNVVFGLLYSKERRAETESIPEFETRLMQAIDGLSFTELNDLYDSLK